MRPLLPIFMERTVARGAYKSKTCAFQPAFGGAVSALTNEFVADQINQMTAAAEEAGYDEDQVEAVATLTGVNRDYMAKALDFIDEEYGSMDEYLHNQIGLTDEEIAQLQG